jgi:1-acyl-sn-glycerol-3-phosphate acyltransferase
MTYTNFPKNKPLKKFLAFFYTFWVGLWFVLIYIFIFPVQYCLLQYPKTKHLAHHLNRIWGKILFPIIGMRMQVQYDFDIRKTGTYVFVPNHFSYWDVVTAGLVVNNYFAFVGKMSVKNIPLLGYMFVKLHIMVDRSEKNSRSISMTRSIKALQSGRSMMMFAEGGILTENPPYMVQPFKDGAFTMAIQQQVPIVPISLYNNHRAIWHADLLLWPQTIKARVHKPIATLGMSQNQIEELKTLVFNVLQEDLLAFESLNTHKTMPI